MEPRPAARTARNDRPEVPAALPVIVNATAFGVRRDAELLERVRSALEETGAAVRLEAVPGAEVEACVRRAIEEGSKVVVVGGGDGTLRTAASVLSGSDAALGVLPLGRHNHFARDLGLPLDPVAAAAALRTGTLRHVDLAEVDGQVFVNNSGLGLYPHLVRHREHGERQGRRLPSFFAAAWRTLLRFPRMHVEVHGPEGLVRLETPLVFVGNNVYEMGPRVGRRNRLDEGVLFLAAARPTGRIAFLWLCARSLVGLPSKRGFLTMHSTEVRIDVRHGRRWLSLDGEVQPCDGRLVYRIRPGALRVVVPDASTPESPP